MYVLHEAGAQEWIFLFFYFLKRPAARHESDCDHGMEWYTLTHGHIRLSGTVRDP